MKLVINADDFGLCDGVTLGIFNAMTKGIVTSTTMMVNTIGSKYASSLVKKYNLNVGLHINLSLGKPLSNCTSLLVNGEFVRRRCLDVDEVLESDILMEIEAQYNRFVELVGDKPTHIDTHLYTHQLNEKVRKVLIEFASQVNLPVREYSVNCYAPLIFEQNFKVKKEDTKESMRDKFNQIIINHLNDDYVELMVHPAFIDQTLLDISSYNLPRVLEHYVLTSNESKKLLEDNNVTLISYSDIKK